MKNTEMRLERETDRIPEVLECNVHVGKGVEAYVSEGRTDDQFKGGLGAPDSNGKNGIWSRGQV